MDQPLSEEQLMMLRGQLYRRAALPISFSNGKTALLTVLERTGGVLECRLLGPTHGEKVLLPKAEVQALEAQLRTDLQKIRRTLKHVRFRVFGQIRLDE